MMAKPLLSICLFAAVSCVGIAERQGEPSVKRQQDENLVLLVSKAVPTTVETLLFEVSFENKTSTEYCFIDVGRTTAPVTIYSNDKLGELTIDRFSSRQALASPPNSKAGVASISPGRLVRFSEEISLSEFDYIRYPTGPASTKFDQEGPFFARAFVWVFPCGESQFGASAEFLKSDFVGPFGFGET